MYSDKPFWEITRFLVNEIICSNLIMSGILTRNETRLVFCLWCAVAFAIWAAYFKFCISISYHVVVDVKIITDVSITTYLTNCRPESGAQQVHWDGSRNALSTGCYLPTLLTPCLACSAHWFFLHLVFHWENLHPSYTKPFNWELTHLFKHSALLPC